MSPFNPFPTHLGHVCTPEFWIKFITTSLDLSYICLIPNFQRLHWHLNRSSKTFSQCSLSLASYSSQRISLWLVSQPHDGIWALPADLSLSQILSNEPIVTHCQPIHIRQTMIFLADANPHMHISSTCSSGCCRIYGSKRPPCRQGAGRPGMLLWHAEILEGINVFL